jgi:hypothetical protein
MMEAIHVITSLVRAGLSIAVLAGSSAVASAQSPADTAAAFVRLRTLAGQWDATEKGNPSFAETVTYSMTGRGTVLVEDMRATSMGHMLTAYHLDKGRLVLTHSCGAGNQPNMRLRVIEEGRRRLQFELHDITNLSSPEAYHSTRVNVSFVGETRVDLEYRGSAGSRETVQVFQLVRKKTSIVRMYVPKHFEHCKASGNSARTEASPTWLVW